MDRRSEPASTSWMGDPVPAARRRRGWRGHLGTLGFLFGAAALLALHSQLSPRPIWTVRNIEVSGNRSISREDLLDCLQLREGLPWWKVSLRAGEQVQAAHPRLRTVQVRYHWPRDLAVAVQERESMLRVLGDPPLELSADGVLLAPQEALDPEDLPLLTGELPASRSAGHRLDLSAAGPDWAELLTLGQRSPQLWKAISEIHYLGGPDFQLFLRDGRKVVLWETGINHDLKEQIPDILTDLRGRRVEDAVLDLRFRDQLVVRLPEEAITDSTQAAAPKERPHKSPAVRGKPKGRRRA